MTGNTKNFTVEDGKLVAEDDEEVEFEENLTFEETNSANE